MPYKDEDGKDQVLTVDEGIRHGTTAEKLAGEVSRARETGYVRDVIETRRANLFRSQPAGERPVLEGDDRGRAGQMPPGLERGKEGLEIELV